MMSKRKLQPHDMLNHSQDIQLCGLVSQNPCLYDSSLPEYKEAAVRERAWENIAADINAPIDICKGRWRNIRDCYRRNKKWRTFGYKEDFSVKPRKVYVLNEYLQFLDIVVDDETRSISLFQQQDLLDGENMVPNIEVVLDVAKSVDQFGQEFKQERVEEDDDSEDEKEGEEEKVEREENQNMFDISDVSTSTNVTSTCNLGTTQTCDLKTNLVGEFTSSGKRKAASMRLMSRKSYKKVPSKIRNRFEQKECLTQSKRQDKMDHQFHRNVSCHEDDTDLFFRSMAITSRTFHPVILAELKKKICTTVMDAVLENEKLPEVHSNFGQILKSASYSSPFPAQNKQYDDSELT